MQSRLKVLSTKQLKEVIGYEGVNTRIRDQREVREHIAEMGELRRAVEKNRIKKNGVEVKMKWI